MHSQRGFSLIELVTVIVLIGVLSAVVGPRFFSITGFQERAYFDELKSAIRFAQKTAIASGCPVTFTVDGSGYNAQWLAGACPGRAVATPGVNTALPGFNGGALAGSAPSGATIAVVGPGTITFQPSGRPSAGAGTQVAVGEGSSAHTFTIQPSGYVL